MAVAPEDLLATAESLVAGKQESDWRTATSRAYYAAFHRCRLVAADAGLGEPGRGSVHAALVDALTHGHSPAALRGLGFMLEQCRKRRVQADYDIDTDFERGFAHTVLDDCRRIFDKAASVQGA